jgi:hypothetical protein
VWGGLRTRDASVFQPEKPTMETKKKSSWTHHRLAKLCCDEKIPPKRSRCISNRGLGSDFWSVLLRNVEVLILADKWGVSGYMIFG